MSTLDTANEDVLLPIDQVDVSSTDFYDAVLAGLFDRSERFGVELHDLEHYAVLAIQLYSKLALRPEIDLRLHLTTQSDVAYAVRCLRFRVAHYATAAIIYHWTHDLVEPRGFDVSTLVGILYRLSVPFSEWRAWIREFEETRRI